VPLHVVVTARTEELAADSSGLADAAARRKEQVDEGERGPGKLDQGLLDHHEDHP
jgi:hypothetical protein